MRAFLVALAFTHLAACAATTGPVSRRASTHDYTRAIEDALVATDFDRRGDLRRCIKNWSAAVSSRSLILQEVLNDRNELKRDSIFLEIGGSTWPRYNYIYVENGTLRSNFENASQLDISGTDLHERLNESLERGLMSLTGRADSTAHDASCYFLSIRKGSAAKSIAMYGKLEGGDTDSLIKALLAAVGRRT